MRATYAPQNKVLLDRIANLEAAYREVVKTLQDLLARTSATDLSSIEAVRGPTWEDSNETCARISCHKNTLNRWRKQGKIPADCWQRTGHRYKYRTIWIHGVIARAGKVGY